MDGCDETNYTLQVLPSDLLGCFPWPFQGLSDLHLGDQKVTWKKLAQIFEFYFGVTTPSGNVTLEVWRKTLKRYTSTTPPHTRRAEEPIVKKKKLFLTPIIICILHG